MGKIALRLIIFFIFFNLVTYGESGYYKNRKLKNGVEKEYSKPI